LSGTGRSCRLTARPIRTRQAAETRKAAASTANAAAGPQAAIRIPPITGPIIEPAWMKPV
jgi:hypothetical protein